MLKMHKYKVYLDIYQTPETTLNEKFSNLRKRDNYLDRQKHRKYPSPY